jgi:probable lipoprotein NlpC
MRINRSVAVFLLAFWPILGNGHAQELPSAAPPPLVDISNLLPPVRGLDFNEPREELGGTGTILPDETALDGISLIAGALSWLGTPYQLGGSSRSGVDCSGFVSRVLYAAVPKLGPFPRRSDEYVSFGEKTTTIEPGDILLFAYDQAIYHVGFALSANTFIHSASEGARTGVIISSLHEGNWRARLYGVRRLKI